MNRDDATRRVMLAIAVGPSLVHLPYTAPDGSQPLVVTTPNEHVSEVIKRIESVGGSANVALAEARKFTIFAMESEVASTAGESNELNRDLSMGMLYLRVSRNTRNGQGTFHLRDAGASVPVGGKEFAYA